jgi:hypothetical protein
MSMKKKYATLFLGIFLVVVLRAAVGAAEVKLEFSSQRGTYALVHRDSVSARDLFVADYSSALLSGDFKAFLALHLPVEATSVPQLRTQFDQAHKGMFGIFEKGDEVMAKYVGETEGVMS